MAKTNIVEKSIVISAAVIADVGKFGISWIPAVDLAGWFIWLFGYVSLNVYWMIKLGPKYLSGSKSGGKIATTLITGVIGAVPALDDFVPELTIQAVSMYWLTDKEAKEEEAANKAKVTNDGSRGRGILSA